MPQPTRLQQVRDQLLKAASRGATNRDAALMAGISENSIYRWLADPDNQEFADAYATAKAKSRQRSVDLIAASDDWKAHAWLLERVDPKHWGKADIEAGTLEARLIAYLQGHADATTRPIPVTTRPSEAGVPALPHTTGDPPPGPGDS